MAFVGVDPDVIRRYLPEWDEYVKEDPSVAGERGVECGGMGVQLVAMHTHLLNCKTTHTFF